MLFFKAFLEKLIFKYTLGAFALENAIFGWEICIKLKIILVETKFAVRRIITIIGATCGEKKNFQIRTIN